MSTKMVHIDNPILEKQSDDHFYHLGITKSAIDIPQMYGDVKFVCMGGSTTRIKNYAEIFAEEVGIKMSDNLSTTDRYVMYKTGQVLWVNVSFCLLITFEGLCSCDIFFFSMIK
ncbi:unnamed protein product [Onchocerca flexuosa]|uniref:SIS domain-containing protein n=1 Tax=Onchocerca flexuosa TaxID=387005 RepID=A0A183I710_9BILA|nr:unnamed protein product [Onchocerca flexuosa]